MKFRDFLNEGKITPNVSIAKDLLAKAGYDSTWKSRQLDVPKMGSNVDEVQDAIESILAPFDFEAEVITPGKKIFLKDTKVGLMVNIELHRGKLTVGILE